MALNGSLALLTLAHTLDSLADVCVNVDGKKIYASWEVLSKQDFFGMYFEESESDVVFVASETGGMHFLDITQHSYEVVRASIFWMMTNIIEFDVGELFNPSATAPCLPKPVPALDVYAFANWYGIDSLAEVALTSMKANFKPATIMGQLFEERIEDYPPVKRAMAEYAKDFLGEVQEQAEYTSILEGMVDRHCSLHETSVMLALLLPKRAKSSSSVTSITSDLLMPPSIHLEPEAVGEDFHMVIPEKCLGQEKAKAVEEVRAAEEVYTSNKTQVTEGAKEKEEAHAAEEAKAVVVAEVAYKVLVEIAARVAHAEAQRVVNRLCKARKASAKEEAEGSQEAKGLQEAYFTAAKAAEMVVKDTAALLEAARAEKEEAYWLAEVADAKDAAEVVVACMTNRTGKKGKKGKK